MSMHERALAIGHPSPLIGILTEDLSAPPSDTAVLLLNSGVIHRVGSCRLSVNLARAITRETELPCLRFDFSGVGDSEARRGTLTAAEAAVDEVQEAMDFLRDELGVRHFVLYGLCSGAYASFNTALRDERVIGIAQIDGYCYMSVKSYWHHYAPRLFSLSRWSNFLKRRLGLQKSAVRSPMAPSEQGFFEVPNFGNFPPRDQVTKGFDTLAKRGLWFFNVFCGGEHYNYAEQFRDCFSRVEFGERLSLHYLPDTSHILAEPAEQARVVSAMVAWIKTVVQKAPR